MHYYVILIALWTEGAYNEKSPRVQMQRGIICNHAQSDLYLLKPLKQKYKDYVQILAWYWNLYMYCKSMQCKARNIVSKHANKQTKIWDIDAEYCSCLLRELSKQKHQGPALFAFCTKYHIIVSNNDRQIKRFGFQKVWYK